jgi:kynurenine formamidase
MIASFHRLTPNQTFTDIFRSTMIFFLLIISIILNFSSSIPLLFIDLSHAFDPTIPFFPSQTRFNFTQRTVQWVNNDNSFFYSTNAFITSEHMGTHIDAPYHFSPNAWKVDEIPLKNLVSIHARIIDVSKQCEKDRNYLITIDDVKDSDLIIPERDENTGETFLFILIFNTGWTKYWPDQIAYAGGESQTEFPGLSEQLAIYLINTYGDQLVGIGIDTLSSKILYNFLFVLLI